MTIRLRMLPALCLAAAFLLVAVSAQAQPDLRQMSGMPLPVAELAPGTVTVRVLRGSLTNPVPSQKVEIVGAGDPRTATTNETGRAEFTGLPPGTRVRAVAEVAGQRVESQEFAIPSAGGIRLMLVASDPGGAAAPAAPAVPAQPGTVVFGDDSRFVFEAGEDGLSVFYILQIVNATNTPVQPAEPVRFELPVEARGATVLEGSSPQASAAGRELKIDGPFAPGATLVQLAYTMPYTGPELVIEQKVPLALTHVAVVAQKIGQMRLASPQVSEQQDMPAQGNLYIAGRGGPVEAGQTMRFQFSGMPHEPRWPRAVAVGLAVLILGAGAWGAFRGRNPGDAEALQRKELEKRRDRLFDELAALELRYREEEVDPERYEERKRELVAALQRIYVALDDDVAVRRAS